MEPERKERRDFTTHLHRDSLMSGAERVEESPQGSKRWLVVEIVLGLLHSLGRNVAGKKGHRHAVAEGKDERHMGVYGILEWKIQMV